MRRLAIVAVLALFSACGGEPYSLGTNEPLVVRDGSYHRGALPGTPSVDGGANVSPTVAGIDSANTVASIGQAGKVFSGRVSNDTETIAIAFLDLGHAYWVVPVGGPDPTNPDQLGFTATVDLGWDIPPGVHALGFVAIDVNGRAGTQSTLSLCVLPDVPDNYNACDPTMFTPPNAEISLSWNVDSDLDLVVETPAGKIVRAKTPTTALVDGGPIPTSTLNDPSTGILTRDSNANCVADGVRRESLVFQGPPPAGVYRVYANLAASCGFPSTDFRLSIYRSVPNGSGGTTLARTDLAGGTLLAIQANGSSAIGTHVTDVKLP